MTGVTHGGDAARLREIATVLRGEGLRVKELGDGLGPFAQVLEGSWSGPDSAALLADVEQLRPAVASVGATLIVWADELRAQADEQTQASGEAGGAGGRGAPGGSERSRRSEEVVDDVRDLANRIMGDGDRQDQGMRNPLLAGLDRPRYGNDSPPDAEPRNVIDGPKRGDEARTGSTSHSTSAGDGVKVSRTTSGSTTDAGVDAKGRGLQTTTVSGTSEVSAEVGKKIGRVGVDGKVLAGTETKWAVTGPDGTDATSVNPLDPEGMPEGTSARLGSSWYRGHNLDASYRAITVSMGEKSGTEHYIEVTRGEGDEVTVLVGDDEFDKAKSALGLGNDKVSGQLSADSSFTEGKAKEVTFDLSTQEGQDGYNRLVLLGKEPQAGDPGVKDVADIEAFSGSRSTGASVKLFDQTYGSTDSNWNAGGLSKHHADGGETVEWSGKDGRTQVGGSTHYDPDGSIDRDKSTYYLRERDVEPEVARTYNQHQGSDAAPSGRQNVAISLTPTDLEGMRYQAAETQAAKINNEPEWYRGSDIDTGKTWTADDVLNYVEGNPEKAQSLATQSGLNTPASVQLLEAQNDDEMLRAMAVRNPVEFQNDFATEHHAQTGNIKGHRGTVTSTGTD